MNFNLRVARDITYPYAYRHNAFSEDECKKIIELAKLKVMQHATTVGESEERKSTIAWLDISPETETIFRRVAHEMEVLNNCFYGFDLWGFESMQYTEYGVGDKYNFHVDTIWGDVDPRFATRKLSASILLEDSFEGGELVMITGKYDQPETIELRAGTIAVFPSFMWHSVRPVILGIRKSLVVWALGPKFC